MAEREGKQIQDSGIDTGSGKEVLEELGET